MALRQGEAKARLEIARDSVQAVKEFTSDDGALAEELRRLATFVDNGVKSSLAEADA